MEELKWLANFGTGGVLAAFIFYFYRQQSQAYEKSLSKVIEDYRVAMDRNTDAFNALMRIIGEGNHK